MNAALERTASLAPRRAAASVRLVTVCKDEVFTVPRHCKQVRVLSGLAWLAVEQQDYVLSWNQEVQLTKPKYPALVSVLGKVPVILALS